MSDNKSINEINKEMFKNGVIGCNPHFRATHRNIKGHNSNFATTLKDLIDNIIWKCNNISVATNRENGENSKIKVSDDNKDGFDNFFATGWRLITKLISIFSQSREALDNTSRRI